MSAGSYRSIGKSRYTNDKMITDHYAIIPTGQGLGAMKSLKPLSMQVYEIIVRRFLAIFLPPAVYKKISLTAGIRDEQFFAGFKVLSEEGYLKVMQYSFAKKTEDGESAYLQQQKDARLYEQLGRLKKGMQLPVKGYAIREGKTSPPKRYNSGSLILAMENAGQLIEDEELRAQIKGSGIGTSATRAEILKKLVTINYLSLHKKTQIITPTLLGEMVFDVVAASISSLLNPELTASWEKGLTYVAEGSVTPTQYMETLNRFVAARTESVLGQDRRALLMDAFAHTAQFHKAPSKPTYRKPAGRSKKK